MNYEICAKNYINTHYILRKLNKIRINFQMQAAIFCMHVAVELLAGGQGRIKNYELRMKNEE